MTATSLAERLVDVCAHVCLTGEEAPLTDELQRHYASSPTVRVGNSLVVGEPDGRPLTLLVGHLDVVPIHNPDDGQPRIAARGGGVAVIGRGTSDMKSGVVVAQALFEDETLRASSPYALALVLYAGEEGSAESNELGSVLDQVPWLREAQLAVVLEPTDLEVQLGCLGGLHAELTFLGRPAHSARPWQGENAVAKGWDVVRQLNERAPAEVVIDGITYHDVVSVTQMWTRNARNIIPGMFKANVNYRFAPDRTIEQAEAELRSWIGDRAEVQIVDAAPPAPPRRDAPLVAALIESLGAPVTGKQAWTDVARFAEIGVPALNYGPGLTSQAHQAGEYVPVANLDAAYGALRAFLAG